MSWSRLEGKVGVGPVGASGLVEMAFQTKNGVYKARCCYGLCCVGERVRSWVWQRCWSWGEMGRRMNWQHGHREPALEGLGVAGWGVGLVRRNPSLWPRKAAGPRQRGSE